MASTSSQEASTSNSPCSDQIFLSFRGEDTRKNFVDHLYTALSKEGFHTFRDNDGIERGEHIKSELQKAIQESRIALVVLSKNYASSSWCLDELVMILKCRSSICGYVVLPLFYHVDPSDVKHQLGNFKEAFSEHEKKIEAKSGETKNEWIRKVGEWKGALKEVADLGGMNLQDMADGHEARFIQKIIEVVGNKLSRTALHIGRCAIGIQARAREIQLWLEDGSADVGLAAICGMGGIGKTTIAKFLYNLSFSRFDGSSFLADVREVSKQQDGLVGLQRQLIADILKGRNVKISHVHEGIVKIKDALRSKRVLVVVDDVDKAEQLEAVLGMREWFFSGSKVIITTRHEHLLRPHEGWKVHRIEKLGYFESLELFSLHAFGQSTPNDDFADASNLAVEHCEGLPLAIKVLGSDLGRSRSLEVWKSQLKKLKAIPNKEILEKLKVSYESLDEYDQKLFLHLACFFVGCHKDYTITILDGCEFDTLVGIDNLIGRCLVIVDEFNKVVMHCLLQEMGRDIVRQESPENPGERSRLWNHKDSYKVLRQNKGTSKIQGLVLNMSLLKDNESSYDMIVVNRNHSSEEFLDNSLLSTSGNWLQRCCLGSQNSVGIAPADSNQTALEADAFAKMENIKLLKLGHVQIIGSYRNFPKEISWLCWHGFPLQSIPSHFPLEKVVVLEMPHSNLKVLFDRARFLVLLKILDLSHSHSLASTPDFRALPNLERLILEDCTRLVEIDESIGQLERLVLLNLKGCSNLRRLPTLDFRALPNLERLILEGCTRLVEIDESIGQLKRLLLLNLRGCSNLRRLPKSIDMLESLRTLDMFGCSNLGNSPTEMRNMDSPTESRPLMPRKNPEPSWTFSLPRFLERLNLSGCNLSDNVFPKDLCNLSSLQELNLASNRITSLPDFVRGLTRLQSLNVMRCKKLRSFVVLQELKQYNVTWCNSLEKVAFLSPPLAELSTVREQGSWENTTFLLPRFSSDQEYELYYIDRKEPKSSPFLGCENLAEISGKFKLEPLRNVDEKIINNLGLFNLGSMGNIDVRRIGLNGFQRVPLQGYHEQHVFYTYLPGTLLPEGFNLTTKGSSLSFTAPSHNSRIRGLSLCIVYELDRLQFEFFHVCLNTIISNTTKRLIWNHSPIFIGVPENDGDMVWLSYWKFENQVESSDELNISVSMTKHFQVKEVGVRLVYEDAEAEMITPQIPSTSEIEQQEVPEEIFRYGLSLPGSVSSDQEKTQVYTFGAAQLDLSRTLQLGNPRWKNHLHTFAELTGRELSKERIWNRVKWNTELN